MANPLHGRRDEMLDTFLLRPEPRTKPTAILRVADLYSGGAITRAVEAEDSLALSYRHDPSDRMIMLDFDTIPDFEVLTATLPPVEMSDAHAEARENVLRFLRVRRPWVFVLMGGDDETLWRMQDWTDRLGYRINRVHDGAAIIGTLGRELPPSGTDHTEGESLVMRLVRVSTE